MKNKKTKRQYLNSTISDINSIEKGEEIIVITSDIIEEDKKQILYHFHNNINPFEIT